MAEGKGQKPPEVEERAPAKKPEKLTSIANETQAHKEAFDLYYSMGAKRSIEAVANTIGKSSRTVGEWSRKYKWKDRIVQREIEESTAQGSTANSVIDAKAEYRKIIRALVATFVKDYKDGKIRIKNIQDFERVVKLDLMLLGDVPVEVKHDVELSEEDRKAIFAVADSIKAEMDALRS